MCEPIVIADAEFVVDNGDWFVLLTIAQSTPASTTVFYSYQQTSLLNSGQPDVAQNIALQLSSTATEIKIPIDPNFNITFINGTQILAYLGTIRDACEHPIKWNLSIGLS